MGNCGGKSQASDVASQPVDIPEKENTKTPPKSEKEETRTQELAKERAKEEKAPPKQEKH